MAVVDYLIGVYPTGIIYTLCGIISLILSIFILGYGLSLIKNTIDGKDNIPAFAFSKNFCALREFFQKNTPTQQHTHSNHAIFSLPGHFLQRFPFLNFLQHFFFPQ